MAAHLRMGTLGLCRPRQWQASATPDLLSPYTQTHIRSPELHASNACSPPAHALIPCQHRRPLSAVHHNHPRPTISCPRMRDGRKRTGTDLELLRRTCTRAQPARTVKVRRCSTPLTCPDLLAARVGLAADPGPATELRSTQSIQSTQWNVPRWSVPRALSHSVTESVPAPSSDSDWRLLTGPEGDC